MKIFSRVAAILCICSFLITRGDLAAYGLEYGKVNHLNKEEAFHYALKNVDAVFIKFSASWCGPCQQLAPIALELAQEFQNILFIHVEYDSWKSLAGSYGVKSLPTIFLFKNGSQIKRIIGLQSKTSLTSALKNLVNI